MPWWGWLAVSLGGYGWMWRFSFRAFVLDNWTEFWFCAVVCLFLCWAIAPLALGVDVLRAVGRDTPGRLQSALAGRSRAQKRKELEQRIAELEREAGLA